MIIIPPIAPVRRRRKVQFGPPAAPSALTLVSASYNHVVPFLELVFDRPIAIGGLDGSAIIVDDAELNDLRYEATGISGLLDPVTLRIILSPLGVATGTGVVLDASSLNGIVAVDDGAAWPGVSDLALPFGPVPNRIWSVSHDDATEMVVELNAPLTSFDDVDKMLGVSVDGAEWLYPVSLDDSNPSNLVFTFAEDVSAATMWRVPGASNWHFEDGELSEPWLGSVG